MRKQSLKITNDTNTDTKSLFRNKVVCFRWWSCLLTVAHLEQELLIFQGLPSSPAVFNGIPAARSVVFCVVFLDYCLSYCPFLLAIVLSVLFLLAVVLSVLFPLAIVLSVLFPLAIVLSVLFPLAIVLSVLFLLSIVLSVLLLFKASDYHFGFFNLVLYWCYLRTSYNSLLPVKYNTLVKHLNALLQ